MVNGEAYSDIKTTQHIHQRIMYIVRHLLFHLVTIWDQKYYHTKY